MPATNRPASMGAPLMTVAEFAEFLGITERHVRRLVFERRIPFLKWGQLLRFDPDEIRRWRDASRQQALWSL